MCLYALLFRPVCSFWFLYSQCFNRCKLQPSSGVFYFTNSFFFLIWQFWADDIFIIQTYMFILVVIHRTFWLLYTSSFFRWFSFLQLWAYILCYSNKHAYLSYYTHNVLATVQSDLLQMSSVILSWIAKHKVMMIPYFKNTDKTFDELWQQSTNVTWSFAVKVLLAIFWNIYVKHF